MASIPCSSQERSGRLRPPRPRAILLEYPVWNVNLMGATVMQFASDTVSIRMMSAWISMKSPLLSLRVGTSGMSGARSGVPLMSG
jgi:hypothetical protein